MTVRGLGTCSFLRIYTSARIIFVDDIKNYEKRYDDHKPLDNEPSYSSYNTPNKIVSFQ